MDCVKVFILIVEEAGFYYMHTKDDELFLPANVVAAQAECDQIKAGDRNLKVKIMEITGPPGRTKQEIVTEMLYAWNTLEDGE